MANWPFAHEYRNDLYLHDGALEVRTEVINRSSEAMPITLGFHPYFNLPDTPEPRHLFEFQHASMSKPTSGCLQPERRRPIACRRRSRSGSRSSTTDSLI